MNKRPLSVTIIAWIFILAGAIGLLYHLNELRAPNAALRETVPIALVRVLAIVAGIFMLRGSNWARWLALAWLAFHVVLSIFHPLFELVFHALLFATITYFLLRARANQYFRAPTA
jgi:hypothetical protein